MRPQLTSAYATRTVPIAPESTRRHAVSCASPMKVIGEHESLTPFASASAISEHASA